MRNKFLLLTLAISCGCMLKISAQTFLPRYNSGISSNVTGYYEYLPEGYSLPENANRKYPLLFYFHGGGELGSVSNNNLERLKQNGIPKIITNGKLPTSFTVNNENFSYIIICPQFKTHPISTSNVAAVFNYILSQTAQYRVDIGKVYLTGFSLGGKASWDLMVSNLTTAKKIAAAIPIATYCYPAPAASLFQNVASGRIAVWALHNPEDDIAIPQACAIDFVNRVNNYNPVIPARYTVACVPGGSAPCDHDSSSWNTIYTADLYKLPNTGLNIYQWLYTHRQPFVGSPPIANAGVNVNITMPQTSVNLNGSASQDPEGSIASYMWRKLSGPSSFTISNAGAVNPIISNLVAGNYLLELKVVDDQGYSDLDTVQVTVINPNPNQIPIANAGTDKSISLPTNSTTLNGSTSNDPDGGIETYLWTKISGPLQYSLSNANIANPLASNLKTGTYEFRLFVTDNQGGTDADTVRIQVINPFPNQAPIARAGNDLTVYLPNPAVLDGSASTDQDGSIETYQWTKIEGPSNYSIANADNVNAIVTDLVQGNYAFELVVTDDSSAIDKDTIQITVSALQRVLIDIGASSTQTGSPDQWGKYWNNMTDARPGLRINNARSTDNVTTTLKLEVVNRIDGTAATYNPGLSSGGSVGIVGEYPSTATTDNAFAHRSTTNGRWRIYGLNPARTYTVKFWGSRANSGTRIIQIKRTDESTWKEYNASQNTNYNSGAVFEFTGRTEMSFNIRTKSGSTYAYISVVDIVMTVPSNQAPVAVAGNNITLTLPTDSVQLNGTNSHDPDGSISSYLWSKIAGPSGFSFSNATVSNPILRDLIPGTYVFELRVTDNLGMASTDNVQVTVNAPPLNQPPVADAGDDIVIFQPTNSADLNATGSFDTDGTISYAWSQIEGPNTGVIQDPSNAISLVQGLAEGSYSFELVVTDDSLAISKDTVIVFVYPPNELPIANAGADGEITLPVNSFPLNGASSDDPDGSISLYQWTKVGGPSQGSISNSSASQPTAINLAAGTYIFELRVIDNGGGMDKDSVVVIVNPAPNQSPIARAGTDITITLPANANLSGSTSSDGDGSISAYLWTKISGPGSYSFSNSQIANPVVSNLSVGSYSFELTVTDNDDALDKDTVNVTVNPAPSITKVLIDLGQSSNQTASPDQWGKYWNNMTDARSGLRVNNAVTTTNTPTSIKLEVINKIGGTASYDPGTSTSGTIGTVSEYPATATNDNAFAHNSISNGRWRIYDLSPELNYTIKFWGSRSMSGNRIIQIKRTTESVWQEYNASMNTSPTSAASFNITGLSDVSFDIRVKSGSTYAYINVVEITITNPEARLHNEITDLPKRENPDLMTDGAINFSGLHAFPNPFKSGIHIVINNEYTGNLLLWLADAEGRIVRQFSAAKPRGVFTKQLNLEGIYTGVYYLKVIMKDSIETIKLVKR